MLARILRSLLSDKVERFMPRRALAVAGAAEEFRAGRATGARHGDGWREMSARAIAIPCDLRAISRALGGQVVGGQVLRLDPGIVRATGA